MRLRIAYATAATALALPVATTPAQVITTVDDPIPGDCDCDGVVTEAEHDTTLYSFINSGGAYSRATRADGDMDYDGDVDLDDLLTVYDAWQSGATQPPIPAARGMDVSGVFDFDAGEFTTALTNSNGDVLIPAGQVFHTPVYIKSDGGATVVLAPTYTGITWHDDGLDLHIAYDNSQESVRSAQRMPLYIPTNFNDHTGTRPVKRYNTVYGGARGDLGPEVRAYPFSAYAPINSIDGHVGSASDEYVMTASMHYDLLGLNHPVSMRTWGSPALLQFFFNPDLAGGYDEAYNVPPGEIHEYTIAIRFRKYNSTRPYDWMHTLRPYRRHFRCTFGPVRYDRDARTMAVRSYAVGSVQSTGNPRGFTGPSTDWPTNAGFGPWMSDGSAYSANGWERQHIRQLAGLYSAGNPVTNFPFQSFTELSNIPPSGHDLSPIVDWESDGTVLGEVRTLGLWWGRVFAISDQWDPQTFEWYDENQTGPGLNHPALRAAELDAAVKSGFTEVGMDQYRNVPLDVMYWTLVEQRQAYPSLRFCVEPYTGDFMHTIGAGYINHAPYDSGQSWTNRCREDFRFSQGVPIFDFLNPGHETWGAIQTHRVLSVNGGTCPTSWFAPIWSEVEEILRATAEMGIVPHSYIPVDDFGDAYLTSPDGWPIEAAESWLDTDPTRNGLIGGQLGGGN